MVALSFSIQEHEPMLLDGRKDQTIRLYNEKRYNQIEHAENLEIYWKLRLAKKLGGSKKLFDADLVEIFPIFLYSKRTMEDGVAEMVPWPHFENGYLLMKKGFNELVRRDGFRNGYRLYTALYKMHKDLIFSEKFFVTRFARKVV